MTDSIPHILTSAPLRAAAKDSAPPARPVAAAQIDELRLRFAAMQQEHDLRPGDIVRERWGMRNVEEDQDVRLLFFGLIDWDNPAHKAKYERFWRVNGGDPTADCWVMYLADDGSMVQFAPATRAMLEPDPDAAS